MNDKPIVPRLTNRADFNAKAFEQLAQAKSHLVNAGLIDNKEWVTLGDVHISTPLDTIVQSQKMVISVLKARVDKGSINLQGDNLEGLNHVGETG